MSAVVKNLTNSEAEAEEWRLRCDMAAVFRLADRLSVLVAGQVIATGRPDEIRGNDKVQEVYRGKPHQA